MPIAISVLAGVSISQSNEDQQPDNFDDWFIDHAIESSSSIEEVFEAVEKRCGQMSDSELGSQFLVISRVLVKMAQDFMLKGHLENALKALDLNWSLMRRADAMYKFPSAVVSSIAVESSIHRQRGDGKAAEKADTLLWKVLKQYEWMDDETELRRHQRAYAAFSLALDSAISHECDSAEYFARDFVHVTRILSMKNEEIVQNQILKSSADIFSQSPDLESTTSRIDLNSLGKFNAQVPEELLVANISLMMSLLSRSLRVHYYLKRVSPSPCADIFQYAARDIYDVIFTLNPRFLPHWKDLKRNMRMSTQNQIKKHQNEVL